MAARPAPSEQRVAISAARLLSRASSRQATLAQAIRRSRLTEPSSSPRASRTLPTSWSFSGSTTTLHPESVLGYCSPSLSLHRRQIRLRLLQRDAWLQPADTGIESRLAYLQQVWPGLFRRPDFRGRSRILKRRRHDAHDGEALTGQHQRTSENARIGRKPAPPKAIADDDRQGPAEPLLFRSEHPASRGRRAQDGKESGRNKGAGDALRHRACRFRQGVVMAAGNCIEGIAETMPVFQPARARRECGCAPSASLAS